MSVKVSELTASAAITSDDLLLTVDDPGGTPRSKKATAQQMLDYVTGSTFNTLTVTSLTSSNIQASGNFSGTFVGNGSGLTSIPNSALNNSAVTVGTTSISLGSSATTIEGVSVLTGSTVTGTLALFTNISGTNANISSITGSFNGNLTGTSSYAENSNLLDGLDSTSFPKLSQNNTFTGVNTFTNSITGTYAYFSNDLYVNGTASFGFLNTVNQSSLVIGDKYITILSGGTDHTTLDGSGILWGSGSTGPTVDELGANAHIRYRNSLDSLEIFPGLYVSGSASISGNLTVTGSSQVKDISGTLAQFTTITASNITIGEAEDGDYTDGLFTTFTSATPVGLVVDRFNEVLKGLAPTQAPSLSNLEKNSNGGNSAKLSFGASSSTGSYFNVTASLSGLSNVDIGGTYSVTNGSGGNPIRLGIFTSLTALTASLNNSVAANSGSFTNYPAKAFNVSADGIGSYIVEMNEVVLSPTGSTTNTNSYNSNNFNLSLANTASFLSTGQGFDLFRHRTGSVSIPTSSWRLGENYIKVTHISSLGTHVTNYIDWIYDPQAASGNSVYGFTTTSSSFSISGLKELSGVKYYTTCTFNFSSSITNYYKNVYSTAANGGITFGSTSTGLTATSFASTPAPTNSDSVLERSSLHTLSGVRVLSGTLTSTMTINNTLGKTGSSVLTTPTILFDNVNTANTNTVENFCLEDYRVISASYDTQSSLVSASAYSSGSALATTELAVYSGSVVYPTRIFNSGNVSGSGVVYMVSGQPNYSGSTEDRYYLRKFVNGSGSLATFNLILTGSNINFTAFGGSLTGNNIKISVKVPGRTGWRDALTAAPANTSGIALNDNVGCLQGSAPSNINSTAAGRSIAINLLTEAIQANESYIVRILASKDWAGTISKLQIA